MYSRFKTEAVQERYDVVLQVHSSAGLYNKRSILPVTQVKRKMFIFSLTSMCQLHNVFRVANQRPTL